ncbi:MAG: efflux RND transporter periplasmic adaptor subunit [Flavobacteriales bacterium]|nr:efflux RND transporter periplasmic adaptor subunit [Flavobacteriales bacterium]
MIFSWNYSVFAQHDHEHDHSHEEAAHTETEMPAESITEASTERVEVLLKFIPIETTEELTMSLFLSDFRSNAPVDSAQIDIHNPTFPEQTFQIKQVKQGIYEIKTIMPAEKMYDLTLDIRTSLWQDKVELHEVDFAHHHESSESVEHEHSHMSLYLIGVGLLIAGIFGGYFLGRRKMNRKAFIVLVMLAFAPTVEFRTTMAHEGHDHGPVKKQVNLTKGFLVEKETQFLLEIRTVIGGEVAFNSGSRLYGTVIPAPDGHAEILSPQPARLIRVNVKPGEHVKKGQTLAVLERTLDAGNDLAIQAERNRLEAEYEAAQKEYDRKKSLQDIASKREVEEAESRLAIAKSNRELFQSGAKNITLVSPVSGIVAPFVLSEGSSVNGGQLLFAVNNLDRVYVEAQAYEKDVEAIESAKGYNVQCMEDFHTASDVKLVSLVQEFNASNQSQRVLFEVNNLDGELKLGEFVNVWTIHDGGQEVMALPEESVTEIEGRPVVFVKNSSEQYELRYISTGDRNGSQIVVREGIQAGERIVSSGAYQTKLIYLNQ